MEEGNYVVEKIVKHRTKGVRLNRHYFLPALGENRVLYQVERVLRSRQYLGDRVQHVFPNLPLLLKTSNDKKLVEDYWEAPVYIGGRYGPPKEPKIEKTVVTINYEKTRLPSWEDDVDQVETITKDERGNLIVFLLW